MSVWNQRTRMGTETAFAWARKLTAGQERIDLIGIVRAIAVAMARADHAHNVQGSAP